MFFNYLIFFYLFWKIEKHSTSAEKKKFPMMFSNYLIFFFRGMGSKPPDGGTILLNRAKSSLPGSKLPAGDFLPGFKLPAGDFLPDFKLPLQIAPPASPSVRAYGLHTFHIVMPIICNYSGQLQLHGEQNLQLLT